MQKEWNHNTVQECGSSQTFNASASSPSESFMLPTSLPLPHLWNFLLPPPAPDRASRFRVCLRFQSFSSKCFCFRFHKNLTASASTSLLSMKQLIAFSLKKKQASLLCKLFHLTCVVDRACHGKKDDFFIFLTGNFLSLHFHSILKVFQSIFHSILKFSSIFHSILLYLRKCRLEAML